MFIAGWGLGFAAGLLLSIGLNQLLRGRWIQQARSELEQVTRKIVEDAIIEFNIEQGRKPTREELWERLSRQLEN